MKKLALFCLIVACILCGCRHNRKAEYIQRYGIMVGYVPGPFFHYGQTKLAEPRHIVLGDIPHEVHKITATIPFTNQGGDLLIIEKVDANYPCFVGWDGDKELYKGPKGTINVYFDKNKIESGSASIPVLIKTNDPSNSEVKIFFDFNVVRSPEEEEIRSLQNENKDIKNEL